MGRDQSVGHHGGWLVPDPPFCGELCDPVRVASDPRINDLCEAMQGLAEAISEMATAFAEQGERQEQAAESARRQAQAAERIVERVLLNP